MNSYPPPPPPSSLLLLPSNVGAPIPLSLAWPSFIAIKSGPWLVGDCRGVCPLIGKKDRTEEEEDPRFQYNLLLSHFILFPNEQKYPPPFRPHNFQLLSVLLRQVYCSDREKSHLVGLRQTQSRSSSQQETSVRGTFYGGRGGMERVNILSPFPLLPPNSIRNMSWKEGVFSPPPPPPHSFRGIGSLRARGGGLDGPTGRLPTKTAASVGRGGKGGREDRKCRWRQPTRRVWPIGNAGRTFDNVH